MKSFTPYCFLFLLLVFVSSCNQRERKRIKQRQTYSQVDKNPYGSYYAYENLNYLFPSASIFTNKESPGSYNSFINDNDYEFTDTTVAAVTDDEEDKNKDQELYLIITPSFYPSTNEIDAINRYVAAGNHVFISANNLNEEFRDSFNIKMGQPYGRFTDSMKISISCPDSSEIMEFAYPGLNNEAFISSYDTNYVWALGWDEDDRTNILQYRYESGGTLTIQNDPLALTNFFLLHKDNSQYYSHLFSYLPEELIIIHWDEYYRSNRNRNQNYSSLKVIMENDSLRAAFWLVLLLFLLIYLFESKRRQRIIPVIKPLNNSSLDFVKTVGRLYYQYHDNKNLGVKMTAHLMDHIRQRYNISTTNLDEGFVQQLAFKSGYEKDKIASMIYHARMIHDFISVSDEELMEFHKQTEAFYKHQ